MHFPIVAGIIGIAIGFEKILTHPEEMLSLPVAITFAAGFALFVGFTGAAVYRTSKIVLVPRLALLILTVTGIVLSIGRPSYLALGITVISLTLLVLIEWKKCRLLFK